MNRFFSNVCLALIIIVGTGEWVGPLGAQGDRAVDEQRVAELIRTYISAELSSDPEEIRVTRIRSSNGGAPGALAWVKSVRPARPGRLLGRVLFEVLSDGDFGDKRRDRSSLWVLADVARIRKVVVASRALRRHHLLTEKDLSLEFVSITRRGREYETKTERLLGKRMTRSIGKGRPLPMEAVEEAPVIHRGDRVMLILESGGLRIHTQGKAREDGFLGGIIGVMNIDSRKVVFGSVVEAGLVKVPFGLIR